MAETVQVVWVARDATAQDLVNACAKGELPFSGPNSLHTEFNKRGWSTRSLYEHVLAAEAALSKARGEAQ